MIQFRWSTVATALMAAGIVLAMPASSFGVLVQKYTFNNGTSANPILDEAGVYANLDATFVDPAGIGQIAGGMADLTRNNGALSNQNFIGQNAPGIGAYIDLPNYSFTDAVGLSVSPADDGAATLELWLTVQENRNDAKFFDFGGNNGGENSSNGGTEYIAGKALNGGNQAFIVETASNNGVNASTATVVTSPSGPLAIGVEHHIVVTVNKNDLSAGPTGTLKMYLNGALNATGAIDSGDLNISNFDEVNSWLGRSQFAEPLFDGLYNEVRIYDHALSLAEVQASNTAGPEEVDLPSLTINRATGQITLANDTGASISLTGFTLTSTAGGLNTAGFTNLGGMTIDVQSATEISTSGNTSVVATASLGNAWTRSSIEDIRAVVEMSDGTITGALINYVGDLLSPIDFNRDGNISIDDYLLFAAENEKDFTGMTRVAASLKGDLDKDFDNDFDDFRLFKAAFNDINGPGALELAISSYSAVPEPASLVLIGSLGLAACGLRRRA
jgi:hypothetical protein